MGLDAEDFFRSQVDTYDPTTARVTTWHKMMALFRKKMGSHTEVLHTKEMTTESIYNAVHQNCLKYRHSQCGINKPYLLKSFYGAVRAGYFKSLQNLGT